MASVVAYAVGLTAVDLSRIGDLGLISAITPLMWLGIVATTFGFMFLLTTTPRQGHHLEWLYLAVYVVMLHGIPALVEPHGRFPTSWVHVGFVDHIGGTGSLADSFDARFSWPGLFSFGAMVTELTGIGSARALIRWASVANNLLYLLPLAVIARHSTRNAQGVLAVLWLYVTVNWVGQDYLSPQGTAFFLFLTIVAVCLRFFRQSDPSGRMPVGLAEKLSFRWPALMRTEKLDESVPDVRPLPPRTARLLVGGIAFVSSVLAFSHQMTPFALVMALVALLLVGGLRPRSLPFVVGVVVVVWVFVGARDFTEGHLEDLLGNMGNLRAIFDENVSERVVDASAAREMVLRSRALLTMVVAAMAGLAFVRSWWARRTNWHLAALAVAGVPLLVLNSYGGEAILRVSFFALPFLCVMAGSLFFPDRDRRRPLADLRVVAFGAVTCLLVPLFVLARFGNESYEMIYDEDLAAVDWYYDNVPDDAVIVTANFGGPVYYRELVEHPRAFAPEDLAGDRETAESLDRLVSGDTLAELPPDVERYLIMQHAGEIYGRVVEGHPDGWQSEIIDDLVATGRYEVRFRSGDAAVLLYLPSSEPRSDPNGE